MFIEKLVKKFLLHWLCLLWLFENFLHKLSLSSSKKSYEEENVHGNFNKLIYVEWRDFRQSRNSSMLSLLSNWMSVTEQKRRYQINFSLEFHFIRFMTHITTSSFNSSSGWPIFYPYTNFDINSLNFPHSCWFV